MGMQQPIASMCMEDQHGSDSVGQGKGRQLHREHSPKPELLSKSTGTDYLIISGKDDTLMPFAGSVDFYTQMKNQGEDVTMQLVEGHGHEVTQEDALDITSSCCRDL